MPCGRYFNKDEINTFDNKYNGRPLNRLPIRHNNRLTDALNSSDVISFDDNSRIVFFSDCHRGDAGGSDDFAPNRTIYMTALYYYLTHGYSYLEIGDGDELWENDSFSTLFNAHKEIFLLMQKFYKEGRLFMIYGNHDAFKKDERYVKENMYDYFDFQSKRYKPLFQNLKVYESLILEHRENPVRIFAVHGHQGDLLNDHLWPVSRLLVRYIWRNIQIIRNRYPFSPAENIEKLVLVENDLINWVKENNQIMIAGHTHNPVFSRPGDPPYFNTGSCTSDKHITCIEIKNGGISLMKWSRKINSYGITKIARETIAGPVKLLDFV